MWGGVLSTYGSSQARGGIGTPSAGPCHSYSNAGSNLHDTYTTAHGNTGSLTHWARPGIVPMSSWIEVGFITSELWQEHCLCHSFYGLKNISVIPHLQSKHLNVNLRLFSVLFLFCFFSFFLWATLVAYGSSLEQCWIPNPFPHSRKSIPCLFKILGLALPKAIWVLMPVGWWG